MDIESRKNLYTEHFYIKSFESDPFKHFKLSSFLSVAQEIAGVSATRMGFGYDDLIKDNNVWVLSRVKVKYLRPPRWREWVKMETWHKREEGLMALRDYELLTEEGESIAVSTSSWLIMNMESRRLKRTSEILGEKGMHLMDRDAIAKSCGKIAAPDNLQFVYTKRVRISDIDYNYHANNARYADWIIDAFGMDFLREHPLDEIQINYNSECTFDNLVEIYKAPITDNSFYVEGRSDGHNIFQSLISFK